MNLSDPNTLQGLYEDVKFKSGLDSLGFNDFVRLTNFALDDYGDLALRSGSWQFDDTTHVDEDGNYTYNEATATLGANENKLKLKGDYAVVRSVIVNDKVLAPIDQKERTSPLSTLFNVPGTPTHYDKTGDLLIFYPTADTAYTVKLLFSRVSPYFDTTDTGATLGIPRGHYKYLSLNIRSQLGERATIANQADVERKLLLEEAKIKEYYALREEDKPVSLTPIMNIPR